jgi:ribokinase
LAKTVRPPLQVAVLGAINWDTTVFEAEFASPGEEVPALRLEEFPGGKGANTAVAAARILGRGAVAFLGALGDDGVKRPLLRSLTDEGVRTDGVVVLKGVASGRAIIVVDGRGRKIIHTHFGANDAFEPRHVRSGAATSVLSAARVTVIMDVPLAAARAAAAAAASGNGRLVYSPGVRAAGRGEELDRVASVADDLVLDRTELAKLSGEKDPLEGVGALMKRYPETNVVATLGPEGCLVGRGGAAAAVPPVDLADLGLRSVNSTGSGDAFLAAYACYSHFGLSAEDAARWGNLAGALKAASAETRGSPRRQVLERSMRRLALRARRPG